MSESEVTQIRDEDVLRRMWQQTEDFSRKKEIRAHMYRLREERLRNLYSPEPTPGGKGCEFTSSQGHVKSFADQTFQSMKSKEVRDAGSPPKEFVYRGQDLKELSNAGWNVESENRTTDDGRTHVKSVNANIEGRYDVEGGRGQFAAVDRQRQAVTEYHDDNSSLRRNETSSDTAAHEHVIQQTGDGTRVSNTTSSSNTSSKIQQVSSTKHETVPYTTDDDYDQARRTVYDTNRNEQVTGITNRDDYEQTLRKNDFSNAELISRKVEYPDDNTKVIVETRCLPDGTRMTSTRREFRVPAVGSRSEHQTRSESKSYSSQLKSDTKDSTSKVTRYTIDKHSKDIVDSQRNVDDYDFKRQLREYTSNDQDDYSNNQQRHVTKMDQNVSDYSQTDNDYSQNYEKRVNNKITDHSITKNDDYTQTQRRVIDRQNNNQVDETDHRHTTNKRDHNIQQKVFKETRHVNDSEERVHNITRERKDKEEKTQYSSKDITVPEDKAHDTFRDGSTPNTERIRKIPREETLPERANDIPRDGTPPVNIVRDIPRDGTVHKNRNVQTEEMNTDEKVHYITSNKVEEIVEKKTSSDHYQTTYQNDFQSRKISTDWSPTHQAWASTLRSDTPTTTRPSTRASSPGSRTFKSSTSSLRSSVSPDKSSKKPTSRGGSPNKVDRHSPVRSTTTDQYSSTHSTHSVTEASTTKTSSPERKPPKGRSPARSGYSPERKPQDIYRQRPSISPEKRPKNFSDSFSPERKQPQKVLPNDGYPRTTSPSKKRETSKSPASPRQSPGRRSNYQPSDEISDTYPRTSPNRPSSSPDRRSTDVYPNRSSTKSSPSPDRKLGYLIPTDSGHLGGSSPSHHPIDDTPPKSRKSPERKPEPSSEKSFDSSVNLSTNRPSISPDRTPNYMRPTAASQPDDNIRRSSKPGEEPDRKSPSKQIKTTKIQEDHYKFVDEETKEYNKTNIDKKVTKSLISDKLRPRDEKPSFMSKLPSEESPDIRKVPLNKGKSPSPQKDSTIHDENDELYGRIDKTIKQVDITKRDKENENLPTGKRSPKNDEYPEGKVPSRETSPSKYGTYDKKKSRKIVNTKELTSTFVEDSKESDYKSLTRQDEILRKNVPDIPSSPSRKSSRDSTSPTKSPIKDTKYKHMTDFIATEKTTEEINKKTTTKDRPRQLVTPSSSPTRKPKTTETELSTGQSSPTTSVSGFVYFGSPSTERPMVTDLDEFYPDSDNILETTKRPESLDVRHSPSPSKIPCRSPSPEKQMPTTKDSLPRKSSLKKPSTDVNQASPIEKPPTSFRVSPTDDNPEIKHKVVKKDHPIKAETGECETDELSSTFKPKPPLQRRETYEDRCRKILGMVKDTVDTSESIRKETRQLSKKSESNENSPSVSPCDSPAPKESSPFPDIPITKKTTNKTVDVTDFIAHERDDNTKTKIRRDEKSTQNLSRESSPTKLQDIKTKPLNIKDKISKNDVKEDTVTKKDTTEYPFSKQSSDTHCFQYSDEKRQDSHSHTKISGDLPKDFIQKRPSESPERKYISSPTKPAKSNLSPERKQLDKYLKETSPSRTSPDKSPAFSKTNLSVTSTLNTELDIDNAQKTTKVTKKTEKSEPTRVLESPPRDIPKLDEGLTRQTEYPRTTSPSRSQPKDGSPVRKAISQEQSFESADLRYYTKPENILHDDVTQSRSRESPEKTPNYMKSTQTTTSARDSRYTTEDAEETHITRTREEKESKTTKSYSPTRKTPINTTRTDSPTKPSQASDGFPKRPSSSPERKLTKDVSAKIPNNKEPTDSLSTRPHEVPGYMKTTTAATTKFESVTNSENTQETTKSKRVDKKRISSGVSDSPICQSSQPKSTSEHRTPSPTKPTRPSNISPDRKPARPQQHSSPTKENTVKNTAAKHTTESSPTRQSPEKIPGYMKSTASIKMKYDTIGHDNKTTEDTQETISSTITETEYSVPTSSETPTRQTPRSFDRPTPEYLRNTSPSQPSTYKTPKSTSPERKLNQHPSNDYPTGKPVDKYPNGSAPINPEKIPGFVKTTTTVISDVENTSFTEDYEQDNSFISKQKKYPSETPSKENPEVCDRPRTLSPMKPTDKLPRMSATSPEQKQSPKSLVKDGSWPEIKNLNNNTTRRVSPERPSYMKPTASITSKMSVSPDRQSPQREPRENPGYVSKPEEQRQLRTPSPIKKTTKITEVNNDFIMSEREQEILNKVQKSLRKLSPERKESSPGRERSPTKTTTSLQDIDIVTIETIQTDKFTNENLSEIVEDQQYITSKATSPGQLKKDKPNNQKSANKPSSRTVSPIKKAPLAPTTNKIDRTPESPTKSRSFSPKKPVSYNERPQSPQFPKVSGIKPREQIPAHLTRKPTPATLTTTKIERLTIDVKKSNGLSKQNILTKTSTSKMTNKSIISPTSKTGEPDSKRTPTSKGTKDNMSPKKDIVTRTASEITMKPKKTSSPQRMKSKPEIHVSDMSTKSPKLQKPVMKAPHSKLPSKPKSATALNTSTDEDDVIIDVQLSKSSRENSPDRICPTPINFDDDVGIPRFPDEVSEPDDELVKRTHHTILETESVVDDIVEICEDEELFVKKADTTTDYDDSLLSVNDKVNKFTSKIHSITKPVDTTTTFKDTEKRVHSDFIDENLKSDECLLTVSEKVNKFAKGPRTTKDSRSPSRKITDEYDRDTVYQDDYTKLSVNDKAHLFVETAENVKVTKKKPISKVERPDLSHVDESLRSDDCLLSVSDKVNKFVKTAEQYFTETHEDEVTDKKIKEQHDKIIRQIVDDDEATVDVKESTSTEKIDIKNNESVGKPNLATKESITSQPRVKDFNSPNSKLTERVPVVKITTLRSSEAVKKAKALFENIASTQNMTQKETTQTIKTTKLTDIGVIKKSTKTDSTTVAHPTVEDVLSPHVIGIESDADVTPKTKERSSSDTLVKPQNYYEHEKPRKSPNNLTAQSPEVPKSKSPMRQSIEINTTKSILSRYPDVTRAESPKQRAESPRQRAASPKQRTESPKHRPDSEKPDKVPGYLRPTKTSQIKEETKMIEEAEVSTRRGSGKFGVELRRTSVERSTISSERRRSVEHHQPCIEDIFDLELLEQMLEKVVGYEQRRRIRAQIRVAKSHREHQFDTNTYTRTTKQTITTPKTLSPERKSGKSPARASKPTSQKILPDSHNKSTPHKAIPDRLQFKEPNMNGHAKEPVRTSTVARQRPQSPEKPTTKSSLAPRTPVRQPSPDKRRTTSPSKTTPKSKGNRFNEYASAYMKKVGLNESDKVKFNDDKTRKTTDIKQTVKHESQRETVQEFTSTKSFTERTSSKDVIEIIQTNGQRSPSPDTRRSPERKVQFPDHKAQVPGRKTHSPVPKTQSPDRKIQSPEHKVYSTKQKSQSPDRRPYSPERKTKSPERLHQRTPTPDFKRPKSDTVKETIIKSVYGIEKKIPSKPVQEEKPSWVTNRNLKKITSETRTYSSKKIENEKPKYRAPSPSKIIAKPIDVITSSYGPGPLDADGKPLFGIKALRNGASNFQVKGTVIRQEFHSRNGGEPEGTVSVTAYSSQPEELEQLLASQGEEPPSRIHGLAAITTTKKFGGDTGNTLSKIHTKEDRASLEQFTHHDRRVENIESKSYNTRTQEFSGDTRREEISGKTRRIESKKENSQTDRNNRSTRKEVKVTEVNKGTKLEERKEKMEKREDKKTVRQSSVKSLTEKYIKSANDTGKSDRSTYPKAGLILRTTTMRDSVSSDDHPALTRTDSEHSLGSMDDTVVTTTERSGDGVRTTTTTRTTHHHHPSVTTHTKGSSVVTHHEPVITTKKTSTVITQEPVITHRVITQEPVVTHRVITHDPMVKVTQGRQGTTTVTTERSFLDSSTKVTGVQDILTRMKNADIVIQEGDTTEDSEARALLNKFLGATVLMAGMQGYVSEQPEGKLRVHQETVRSSSSGGKVTSRTVEELDLDQCWDERLLKKLLDECTDYEQRRRLRARIRTLMAEQEACASAVTEALGAAGANDGTDGGEGSEAREEEEVTVTSSVRRDSSDKTVSSSTSTKTSKVIETTRSAPKPVSPFAKFRQLEKQNSTTSPNSPKTPQSPGSPSQPYFKFTDPALQASALTIKERLLQWCRDKTRDYENVKLENFSTSWADGLAFCALVHHFLPDAFDYSKLTADKRRHNFTLAFKVADEKAGIYPLLDVDDMVAMRKPDWKCVFTYVQAIYRRFKDEQ